MTPFWDRRGLRKGRRGRQIFCSAPFSTVGQSNEVGAHVAVSCLTERNHMCVIPLSGSPLWLPRGWACERRTSSVEHASIVCEGGQDA